MQCDRRAYENQDCMFSSQDAQAAIQALDPDREILKYYLL